MSNNDFYINSTEWEKIRNKKWKEENKERHEFTRRLYLEQNKDKINEYQRLRTLKSKKERAEKVYKLNIKQNSDKFKYNPSNFVLKETLDDVELPIGKQNK